MYAVLRLVPLTLCFILIAVFHVNITSGPLLGYMIFCQFLVFAVREKHFIIDFTLSSNYKFVKLLILLLLTLCEVWDLNFFKPFIPPFCISEYLSTVHIKMLDLLPVIYLLAPSLLTSQLNNILYIDPMVTYDSIHRLIYVCIALIACILVVFIPSIFLFLYPTRIYRDASRFSPRKRLAITVFVETINSCFKDGLNGTSDYRALAGLLTLTYNMIIHQICEKAKLKQCGS